MTKCQRLVHMLTVKKGIWDKLNRHVLKAQIKRMEETKQERKLKPNDKKYKDNNVIWKMWGRD